MTALKQWLKAAFRHRSLIKSFAEQELRAQVAGSAGGPLWLIFRPALTILLYVFVFSVILQLRVDALNVGTDNFVLYLLSGLLPWMAFSDAVSRAPNLLIEKSSIITKVAFPIETIPISSVVVSFALNGIGLLLFIVYQIFFGHVITALIALPLIIGSFYLFTCGIVAILSAVGVFLRDTAQFVGVLVSFIFYLTPILYPMSLVPDEYLALYRLNPMLTFVESFQIILLTGEIPWQALAISCMIGSISYLIGGYFFMKLRNAYNDVL